MRRASLLAALAIAGALVCGWLPVALACPFCTPVVRTFGEELAASDVIVFARMVDAPVSGTPGNERPGAAEPRLAKFAVEHVLRGGDALAGANVVEAAYVGEARSGVFLLTANESAKLDWGRPIPVNDRQREYVRQLLELPSSGVERLRYFLPRLENADEMLARDAFDEFTKAAYEDVIALRSEMQPERLVGWILDPAIPATRRRLYFTMLGVCGGSEHVPLLEKLAKSKDRRDLAGLDALIACYLTLKGAEGLPLVEELYLANRNAEYTDAYSAVMAIRFHGTEMEVIPRPRLAAALRHLLDRPDLADLVIPDLARWEDWESLDRLVALFKASDEKTSWVRAPVINYLRACPLPEAAERIRELERIDPESVKKAYQLFPLTPAATPVKS